MKMAKEVRNPANRLVCMVDELTGDIEIQMKGWVTIIRFHEAVEVEILHAIKEAV